MPADKRIRTLTRRSFIQTTAATGAALTAGSVFSPAVHAQARPIKLGYVSPQTGPLAAFAEADNFVLGQFREAMKGGLRVGSATRPIEVIVKDSQSNPNRAAEVAKELIVDDEVDLMLVASTPETTNPVSTQCEIEEVPCISTKAPVAALVHRPAGQPGRRPARLAALQLRLPLLLGPRGRHRRLHQHVEPARHQQDRWAASSPTTPTATPGATRRWASRRARRAQGYKLTDPGRYQNLTDDFSAQINAFKDANCRDRHRRGDPARLHDVLEPGPAAGLQAQGGIGRQGASCSRSRSRRWARTATTSPPRSGGRPATPSSPR